MMGKPKRLLCIEGLRGVASVSVAWFHLTNTSQWSFLRASGSWGWLGVEAFFVISGFVIPYSLWIGRYELNDFWRYMARRTLRIEPPYVVSVLLTLTLWKLSSLSASFLGTPPIFSLWQIIFHLFYLIPLTHYAWISPVYWSLAYEFTFYVVIGLLYSFLFSRNLAWSFALALMIFLCSEDTMAFLFLIGIAVMRYKVGMDSILIAGFFSILAAALLAVWAAPLFGAVGLATGAIIAFVNLDRLARPLAFLGTISYSLYLTHVPIGGRVVNFGRRFLGGGPYELVLSACALAVAILAAWIFHLLIEKQATRMAMAVSYRPLSRSNEKPT